jgi:hypothetical protein
VKRQSPRQKNIIDIEAPKSEYQGAHDGAIAKEPSIDDLFPSIRQPIKITKFEWSKWLKPKITKQYKYAQVLGAAGPLKPELVSETKLKEISDPYTGDIRKALTDILLSDPIASPAARYSIGALFEDGFELKLTLASQFSVENKRQLTPEEIDAQLLTTDALYYTILERLDTWKSDCDVEQLAKDLHGVSLAQGKAAGMMLPGILDLKQNELPKICEIIPADDLSNPVIDSGATRKIVAVKLDLEDEEDEEVKDILRADEIVYYVTGIRGLRREAKYQGVSPLEPVLQISKALKRLYHLDMPLASVSAYITKQLIKVSKENLDDALQSRINSFMSNLFKSTTWAMAMPDWYDGVDPITPKVDWPMFDGIEQKMATVELSAMGVPKSAMNREQDLNRDIATIQAIQFVRFVRKPAEEAIKKVLENQIFNPLMAHLAQKELSEIPVRIDIVRKVPEGGDIDKMFDTLSEDKNNDMNSGNMMQNQSQTDLVPIGASGELKKLQIKTYKKLLSKIENENK